MKCNGASYKWGTRDKFPCHSERSEESKALDIMNSSGTGAVVNTSRFVAALRMTLQISVLSFACEPLCVEREIV